MLSITYIAGAYTYKITFIDEIFALPFDIFDRLATTTTTNFNSIKLNHNLGRASWWVRWWACAEHRGEWSGDLAESLAETSIEVDKFDEHLNVSTTWLDITYPKKQTSSSRNWHFDQEGRASVMAIATVMTIKTVIYGCRDRPGHWNRHGIVTVLAIETDMAIVTALAIEIDIYLFRIEPGIECKEVVVR